MILNEPQNCEFVVEYTKSRKRIQRRKYFRVDANFRMIIEQMDKSPEFSTGPRVRWWKKTKILTGLINGNKQYWVFFHLVYSVTCNPQWTWTRFL